MDVATIIWIAVAAVVVAFVVAVAILTGLGALGEFSMERSLNCERCGRSGPFPEREMMKLRDGLPAHCPDCGTQLTRRKTNRAA